MIDFPLLQKVAENSIYVIIDNMTKGSGVLALRNVIETVSAFHAQSDTRTREQPFFVFCKFSKSQNLDAHAAGIGEEGETVNNYPSLIKAMQSHQVYEVIGADNFVIWGASDSDINPWDLSDGSLVYRYHQGKELLFVNGVEIPLQNLHKNAHTCFAQPTFLDLEDALEIYKNEAVRLSTCYIIQEIWFDENKLFVKGECEFLMRRSLEQFLRTKMRGVKVDPEYNVNETKPVDIRVTWDYLLHAALIEIKWLGNSGDSTVRHRDQRARDGAGQLANYLDAEKIRSPRHDTLGYLVNIDARRRGLRAGMKEIDREDGMYYADQEIEYNPAYHETRDDFREPLRMFSEPKCQ